MWVVSTRVAGVDEVPAPAAVAVEEIVPAETATPAGALVSAGTLCSTMHLLMSNLEPWSNV